MTVDNLLFDELFRMNIPYKEVKFVSPDCQLFACQKAMPRKYINELSKIGIDVEQQLTQLMIEEIVKCMNERENIKCFNILKNIVLHVEEKLDIVYFRIQVKVDEILNLDNDFL